MRPFLLMALAACALTAQEDIDRTIATEYQKVLELAAPPSEGGELTEGEARARGERFKQELERFLARWARRAGELDRGRLELGRAYAIAGKPGKAVPHLEDFLQKHPNLPESEEAEIALGTALLDSGDAGKALERLTGFLARHAESDQRHVASFYSAIAHIKLGNEEAALPILQAVAASGGTDAIVADASIKHVEVLRDLGRVAEARKALEGLLSQHPEAPYLLGLKEQLAWIGREAPEFVQVETWVGPKPESLASLKGRVVVLNFFADRYEACRQQLRELGVLERRMRGREVTFLGLTKFYRSLQRVPRERQIGMLRDFVKQVDVGFACGMAEGFENLRAYGVRGIPHTVVIGRDGRITHLKFGASPRRGATRPHLERAIERALEKGG